MPHVRHACVWLFPVRDTCARLALPDTLRAMPAFPARRRCALSLFLAVGIPLSVACRSVDAHHQLLNGGIQDGVYLAGRLQQQTAFANVPATRVGRTSGERVPCASRERIPRPGRRNILTRRWLDAVGDDGKDNESSEDEGYFPTEDLLEDPSHMERIMASMARLLPPVPAMEGVFESAVSHHCALRTADITRAMKFYSLLGMKEVVRFRAEDARCAFLEGAGMRLELIEVPASMQPPSKAADLATDMRSTGLNHMAFDVGPAIQADGLGDMKGFLSSLNRQSEEAFGMSVRLAVSPYEQRIGQDVYDLAFIMDADGVLLELVHHKLTLDTKMPQAW